MSVTNKRRVAILIMAACLLLIPFIAMQFTNEVSWKASDFLVMGVLLVSTGLACEFTLRKIKKVKYRILICIVVLVVFLLAWAELAVGIFGTPFAGS